MKDNSNQPQDLAPQPRLLTDTGLRLLYPPVLLSSMGMLIMIMLEKGFYFGLVLIGISTVMQAVNIQTLK